MTKLKIIATAARNLEKDRIIRSLLDDLLDFARVKDNATKYGDVEFFDDIDGSPGKLIADAITQNPALWMNDLPQDVLIVPRAIIIEMGYDQAVAGYFNDCGRHMVEKHAYKAQQGVI